MVLKLSDRQYRSLGQVPVHLTNEYTIARATAADPHVLRTAERAAHGVQGSRFLHDFSLEETVQLRIHGRRDQEKKEIEARKKRIADAEEAAKPAAARLFDKQGTEALIPTRASQEAQQQLGTESVGSDQRSSPGETAPTESPNSGSPRQTVRLSPGVELSNGMAAVIGELGQKQEEAQEHKVPPVALQMNGDNGKIPIQKVDSTGSSGSSLFVRKAKTTDNNAVSSPVYIHSSLLKEFEDDHADPFKIVEMQGVNESEELASVFGGGNASNVAAAPQPDQQRPQQPVRPPRRSRSNSAENLPGQAAQQPPQFQSYAPNDMHNVFLGQLQQQQSAMQNNNHHHPGPHHMGSQQDVQPHPQQQHPPTAYQAPQGDQQRHSSSGTSGYVAPPPPSTGAGGYPRLNGVSTTADETVAASTSVKKSPRSQRKAGTGKDGPNNKRRPKVDVSGKASRDQSRGKNGEAAGQDDTPPTYTEAVAVTDPMMRKFMDMGFPRDRIARGLVYIGGDDPEAVFNYLVALHELMDDPTTPLPLEAAEEAYQRYNDDLQTAKTYGFAFQKVKEMGFDEVDVRVALRTKNNNAEEAIEALLSGELGNN
eukprot:Clim_evm20s150 gene=Clim_evmTU20s150